MCDKLAIVDLANLPEVEDVSKDEAWIATAGKLREGLGTVGFLYLINHGIPEEAIDKVFAISKQFFELPEEIKLKYGKETSRAGEGNFDLESYGGYAPVGKERAYAESKLELKEAFDWVIGMGRLPTDELPQFQSVLLNLDGECKKLVKKLLRLMALSLHLEDTDFFLKGCRHLDNQPGCQGLYSVKFNHYPGIPEEEDLDPDTMRVGEHPDFGLITLLFQDQVGGLEVRRVEGEWVEVEPMPGAILVNTGDLVELWTGGIFPATPHRVPVPKAGVKDKRKDRYSIVFFNGPDTTTLVKPISGLERREEEEERLSRSGRVYGEEPVNGADYMLGLAAKMYLPKNQ